MSKPKPAPARRGRAGDRHPILKINHDGPSVIRDDAPRGEPTDGDTSPEFRLEPVPAPPHRPMVQPILPGLFGPECPPPLRPDMRWVARPRYYRRR